MSSRRPLYLTGIGFLALLLTAPQIWFVGIVAIEYVRNQSWPLPRIPGFDGNTIEYMSELSGAPLWQDQFVQVKFGNYENTKGEFEWNVLLIDPETGDSKDPGWKLTGNSSFTPMASEDQLWFISSVGSSHQVVDGALQPCSFTWSTFNSYTPFLIDGKLAKVTSVLDIWILSVMESEKWTTRNEVVLPHRLPGELDEVPAGPGQIKVLNHQGKQHVFLRLGGHLLHREGLELNDIDPKLNPDAPVAPKFADFHLPASALKPVNTDQATAGWRRICADPEYDGSWHPMFIGGQPALLMTVGDATGNPTGELHRFDGASWSLQETKKFPFGSKGFHVVSRRDGQKSYMVVSTSLGRGTVYSVDDTGIQPLKANLISAWSNPVLQELLFYVFLPTATLVLGLLLGLSTWFWMWLFTKNEYSFGIQTVRLASLGWRGLAKLIDLTLLLATTVGVFWLPARNIDWTEVTEALNLRVTHPSVDAAWNAILIALAWLVVSIVAGLVIEGRWGLTPGKWCCGLRTKLSTLKPCGLSRSLLREVLMCVDCCNLFCWTPGILTIALTDRRQRVGDLIADTIVVVAKSLPR